MYRNYLKRPIDFILSFFAFVVLFPVFIITSALLFIQNQGQIFFIQVRPGLRERPFKIIKFKTMNDNRDGNGRLLPDVQRITRVGNIVRKMSVDELPQLVNVLMGDMSLVGPRPLLFKYLPLYSDQQRRRHNIRPGITGWAQVNGRNAISWRKKFEYDVFYVDNVSFVLDMKIIALTISKVLRRQGINHSHERPMQPFTGNN